ncbi:MAG: hypothetical protein AVDCRST_MAG20-225 [uncultured Acidimicrobiales bacterium]|uniref:Uncharacterized protein n=1 Tax=uncultured Acidimicrobiales bacterium TaxID=310071 RepID=A0A6J4H5H7_9ACTN|nr:MAG: hypothetical protein AVDCRST_MAG20-225 [uncultured Acidimicrobiales bacterium]
MRRSPTSTSPRAGCRSGAGCRSHAGEAGRHRPPVGHERRAP